MWRKGRSPVGEKSKQAKLTANQVLEIQKLLRAGIWRSDIARHYKVHYATVDRIAQGKQWRSLGVVKVKKRRAGTVLRCAVVEKEPLRMCGLKAATKFTYEGGEVVYFCSGHGLPLVLEKNEVVAKIERV